MTLDSSTNSKRIDAIVSEVIAIIMSDVSWPFDRDQAKLAVENAARETVAHYEQTIFNAIPDDLIRLDVLVRTFTNHMKSNCQVLDLVAQILRRDRFAFRRNQGASDVVIAINYVVDLVIENVGNFELKQISFRRLKALVLDRSTNRLRTMARQRQNRPFGQLEKDPAATVLDSATASAVEQVSLKEQIGLLNACLNSLSSEQRTVVNLRLTDDLDYSDLSQLIGAKSAALRQSMRRSLRKLRECLLRKGVSAQDLP